MNFGGIMKVDEVFNIVSRAAKKRKIACLLIGGFALSYYKVMRQTMDADFLITNEGLEKIRPDLKKAGFREEFIRDIFARFGHQKRNRLGLDFLFVDQGTLEKMLASGRKIRLADGEFYIPSLEHLLALKLHSLKNDTKHRLFKDLPDILNLIHLNKFNYKTKKFEKLCLRYADGKIYHTIMGCLKNYG